MTSGQRFHKWERRLKIAIIVIAAFILSLPFALIEGLNHWEFIPMIALVISGLVY